MKKLISLVVCLLVGISCFAETSLIMEKQLYDKLQRERERDIEKIEALKLDKNITDINLETFTAYTTIYMEGDVYMDEKTFNKYFEFIKKMEEEADFKLDLEESLSVNCRVETATIDGWEITRKNDPDFSNMEKLVFEKNNVEISFESYSFSENIFTIYLRITIKLENGEKYYKYSLSDSIYKALH